MRASRSCSPRHFRPTKKQKGIVNCSVRKSIKSNSCHAHSGANLDAKKTSRDSDPPKYSRHVRTELRIEIKDC